MAVNVLKEFKTKGYLTKPPVRSGCGMAVCGISGDFQQREHSRKHTHTHLKSSTVVAIK